MNFFQKIYAKITVEKYKYVTCSPNVCKLFLSAYLSKSIVEKEQQ